MSNEESVRFDRPDVILQAMVGAAESTVDEEPFSVPITLNVKGLTVTGNLVTYKVWRERVVARTGIAYEANENVHDMLLPESSGADQVGPGDIRHIHVVDARIVSAAGAIPTSTGIEWRGRLGSIDGWWFGSLTVD